MIPLYNDICTQLKKLGVTKLSLNSTQLNAHTAFVALPGIKHHGLDFIDQAIAAQAPCVIIDAQTCYESHQIMVIRIQDLMENLGHFAAAFYDHPSKKLELHATTGTNGKTSCSQFIAQALSLRGEQCAVIGTLGMGIWPDLIPITNTTPDAITLQNFLADCVLQGIKNVALEASSIGLEIGRMQGCRISSALFTNLTQDHLDYHHTMESYAAAKQLLFDFPGLKTAIINADDPFGQKLLVHCKAPISRWAISIQTQPQNTPAEYNIHTLTTQFSQQGIQAQIQTPEGIAFLASSLLGQFNLENLLLITAWLLAQGITLEESMKLIAQLQNPKGRMASLRHANQPLIVIDYAHTPDALKKALTVLRNHCSGKLWCVFGCGGDRDAQKRPLMGNIACQLADHVIVTTDNPRYEDPATIAAQVLPNPILGQSEIILDREQAIAHAIAHAQIEDVILIAGKGHETYQEIKDERFACDDFVLAEKYLR